MKQYPAAIKAYTAYIVTHPNDTVNTALLNRGMAEYQLAQFKEATVDLETYARGHPDKKLPLIFTRRGAPPSLQEFEAALAQNPNNFGLRSQYAMSLASAKRFADAIAQYDIILAAHPDDYSSRYFRGLDEEYNGDHAKAIEDMLICTKAKPKQPFGWMVLALAYSKQGKWQEAEDSDSKAIALDPNDIDSYKGRGIAEYNLRDYGAAFQDLEKYNEAKSGDEEARKLLAEVSSHIIAELPTLLQRKEHLQQHPDDFRPWHELGVIYLSGKRYSDAIDALTKAITLKQEAPYFFERGWAYYSLSTTDPTAFVKALADANAALALKPNYDDARLLKADSEFGAKNYAAAANDYIVYLTLPSISVSSRAYAERQVVIARQRTDP